MKTKLGIGLTALVFVAGLAMIPVNTQATMDVAKKEKASCTVCHVKAGSKELNDVGKCYEKNKKEKDALKTCEKKEEKKK